MSRFLLLLCACSAFSAPVFAADQPQLLFTSNRTGSFQIFLMNADGSGAKNLTNSTAEDTYPAWSPDGRKIAFTSTRAGNRQVFVMDADGGNVKQLTKDHTSRAPTWSPDGKKIAFTRHVDEENPEIFVMNADGSNQINLTNDPAYDADAAWSPDGKKIVFVSNRAGDGFRVYTIDPDRGNTRAITTTGNTFGLVYPAWSPDGKLLAFADSVEQGTEVFVSDAKGMNKKQLTKMGGLNSYAAWSPDGKKIAFQHHADIQSPGTLHIMDADGSNVKEVIAKNEVPAEGGRPAWRPK